jgi:hypothetical protein
MAGIAAADLPIGRILDLPAHVSGINVAHASETLENSLDTPKTAAAEYCCLLFCHGG